MKIISLECWTHEMRLKVPYTIAYETVDHCTNVFLKAITDTGITGWGCAAPDKVVTGEKPESVIQFFRDCIDPLLRGCDPWRYAYLLEEAKKINSQAPSALAMMDMVLFDLISREARVPLFKFLGGYRSRIATSITIGILPVNETLQAAEGWISRGYRILKIKGGKDYQEDIERVLKLRETYGRQIEIRFDANQGYQLDEALAFIEGTKQAMIEVFEQPTPKAHEKLLGAVSRNVPVPVMADESLLTLRDAFRLTRHDLADMINIKLMKVGGIHEALHINSVGKSAGVESMIGCMDESELGIAAGLHVALARPNVLYADLDGHLDLEEDPFTGLTRLEEGILFPGTGPGLGEINPG
jgi:L-alanine-DL-glutamate epimerase-like enolase superfamily enzyme